MLPYIHIGQITISTYYTAMILGYILMVVLMLPAFQWSRHGLNYPKAIFFSTMVLIAGVLGCKLLFILENPVWIQKNGFTFGGFSFYGAVFLVPLMMALVGKLLHINLRVCTDYAAICIIAMLGTIRLGCFLNGCCGGRVFAVHDFLFTLPTQLIECVIDFLILGGMLKAEKKEEPSGLLYPQFLLQYGSARFFIEFLRATDKDWLFLSHAQWFSIFAVMIGALILFRPKKEAKD